MFKISLLNKMVLNKSEALCPSKELAFNFVQEKKIEDGIKGT